MDRHAALASRIAESVRVCENGPWMIPCRLELPTGAESGHVLVIGVGGSTLRLTEVSIPGGSERRASSVDVFVAEITPSARAGDLFAWCAAQLAPHLETHFVENSSLLALSWSFPLLHGRIQTMGKTFSERYVGRDLLEVFNAALPAKFRVQSVTHDGLASLVAGVYTFPSCVMALTLGTGVNVTVVGRDNTLVNTEISMLGRPDLTPSIPLPTEAWDIRGAAAEFQPFETQVGGLWLGPMAANAVAKPLTTLDLWAILEQPTHEHYAVVDKIVSRSASLVAASLYGLALAFNTQRSLRAGSAQQVAYTGGVVFEPQFRRRLDNALAALAACFGFSLELVPERQGSEVGAAIAALASTAAAVPQNNKTGK